MDRMKWSTSSHIFGLWYHDNTINQCDSHSINQIHTEKQSEEGEEQPWNLILQEYYHKNEITIKQNNITLRYFIPNGKTHEICCYNWLLTLT